MSIASFKKSVWETALMTAWRGVSVADAITTPPTRIEGEKAIFNVVSGGTIKDYTGTIEYDEAGTDPIELAFDQKKYWAIKLRYSCSTRTASDSEPCRSTVPPKGMVFPSV